MAQHVVLSRWGHTRVGRDLLVPAQMPGGRAAQHAGHGGRADARRRQLNAGAAPVFPRAKRKPERKGRAGFAVASSRKKVPPSRKGTITIIPYARPRTSGASPCQRSADEGAHQRELVTPAAPTTVTAAK